MNTWNSLSIKWKQTFLYLTVGIFPLITIAVIIVLSFQKVKTINASQFQTAAEEIADKIDRNLFERYGDVQAFGLNTILQNREFWYQKESPIVDAMNSYVDTYDIYYFTLLVDLNGKVIAINNKDQDGQNIPTEDIYNQNFKNTQWFNDVINKKFYTSQKGNVGGNSAFTGTVIYPLHRSKNVQDIYSDDDGLTIGFIAPVYDTNGDVVAIWHNFAKFSLVEEFFIESWKALEQKGLGKTELTLLNEEGEVIIDHDPSLGQGTSDTVKHDFNVLFKLNLAEKGVGAAVKSVSGENGFMYAKHARKKIVQASGFAHHKGALGFPGMNWSVLVRAPDEVVNASLVDIQDKIIFTTVVVIVLTLIIGRWSANQVILPVQSLTTELKKFSEGEIYKIKPLNIKTNDEFKQLDNSFRDTVKIFKEFMMSVSEVLSGTVKELKNTAIKGEFKKELDKLLEKADETSRIRTMVDNSPTHTLMADLDFKMIYANPSTLKFLKNYENIFNYRAENLIGQSIDIFHKDPNHQKNILRDPKNLPHQTVITIGNDILSIMATAVYNQDQSHIGSMLIWDVITEKKAMEEREKEVMQQISKMSKTLAGASDDLTETSSEMSSNAEKTSEQASEVSNICEEVSQNVQTVASGTEEMSISIKEIAKNSSEAANVTSEAVKMAENTNVTISNLGTASSEISEVIKVITSIAEQTNLLALNATIEAARAGEAGKGFAVVANEVKELAKETSKATEDIGNKISGIQKNTKEAVDAIAEITEIINRINDISSTIASSVEEQSATTAEMGRNVSNAADGSRKITERMTEVTEASNNTTSGANTTKMAANGLSKLASELQELVNNNNHNGH